MNCGPYPKVNIGLVFNEETVDIFFNLNFSKFNDQLDQN